MEWKDAVGLEGLYQVSSTGLVKSLKRKGLKEDKIMTPITDKYGYLRIRTNKNGKANDKLLSRLIALAWIPNPLGLLQVHHKDGNKLNNDISNLEWVNAKENTRANYLLNQGANQKFTVKDIENIFRLKNDCLYSNCSIARMYGVASQTIDKIINGKRWGWLK